MTHAVPDSAVAGRVIASDSRTSALLAPSPKVLHGWANAVVVFSILYGAAAIVAGIAFCANTVTVQADEFTTTTAHPYLGVGVGLIVAGVLPSLLAMMLAQWAILYAQSKQVELAG